MFKNGFIKLRCAYNILNIFSKAHELVEGKVSSPCLYCHHRSDAANKHICYYNDVSFVDIIILVRSLINNIFYNTLLASLKNTTN